MLCVWRAELTEVNTRWNSGGETKMSSQGLGHRSTETAEKSRMAGKRLAKLEKRRYRESNSGPSHYECDALPLSYSANECKPCEMQR